MAAQPPEPPAAGKSSLRVRNMSSAYASPNVSSKPFAGRVLLRTWRWWSLKDAKALRLKS